MIIESGGKNMNFSGKMNRPDFTPDELAEIERDCERASAWREKDDADSWDAYCAEQDEKEYREARAKLAEAGLLLTYDEAKTLAMEYYCHGGDMFYECVSREEYEPVSKDELLDHFSIVCERFNQCQYDDSTKIFPKED
jgi:hypothetical protein